MTSDQITPTAARITPPFTLETARAKVKAAENAWNSRDPEIVAQGYTEDSEWRNRTEVFEGREAIKGFLKRKWEKGLDCRLMKGSGALLEIESPCASSTNGTTRMASGTVPTETSIGSLMRMD
jgi:hypothetical protein